MTYKLTVTTLALTAITSTVAATHAKPDTEHPHIVLILCDDMGFSVILLRRRIHTPNIDYLAEQGIRFSQFKNTGRSWPQSCQPYSPDDYQHEAGMGWMTAVGRIIVRGIGTAFGSPAHPCRSTARSRLCHLHEWQMACYLRCGL